MDMNKTVSIDLWAPKFPSPLKPYRRAQTKGRTRVGTAIVDRRVASVQASDGVPKSRGVEALLEGSAKSHYNTLVGHTRIPHKYDHFHEKTYVGDLLTQRRKLPRLDQEPGNLFDLIETGNLQQTREFFLRQKALQLTLNRHKPRTALTKPRGLRRRKAN